jgi:hypothetical protein
MMPILIALAAQQAGVTATPGNTLAQTLTTMAQGLDQIPAGEQLPVLIALTCNLVNKP